MKRQVYLWLWLLFVGITLGAREGAVEETGSVWLSAPATIAQDKILWEGPLEPNIDQIPPLPLDIAPALPFGIAPEVKIALQPKTKAEVQVHRSSAQIRLVQQRLKAEGFDPGPLDGILGPRAELALLRYQLVHELLSVGTLDEAITNLLLSKDEVNPSTLASRSWSSEALKIPYEAPANEPRVSIGRPETWSLSGIYPPQKMPPAQAGYSRSGHGSLLCAAQFSGASDTMAINGLIGMNSITWAKLSRL